MPIRVSLTMIVKNEETNLPSCLACVADLVDEIVIVDTGSADRSKEMAESFGARVFDFAWIDDFAAARNEALRHARGDWIFWLDADDRIDEPNRQRLRTLFADLTDENVAYAMTCVCQSSQEAGSTSMLQHTRLFRRHPDVRWQYRIHEQVLPSLERSGAVQRMSDVTIQHCGYQDAAQRRCKLERDLRLLQLENTEHPNDPLTLFHLGWTLHLLGHAAQALQPLWQCLQIAPANLAIVRKAYVLLVRGLRQVGDRDRAWNFCQSGRARYPQDAELCFHHGQILKERGEYREAEIALRELLQLPRGRHSAIGDDPGLCGFKGRCALAEVYRDSGRLAEAEAQYRLALAEQPDFLVAWLCLGDIMLTQNRWDDAEQLAQQIETRPEGRVNALLLRARSSMFRQDYAIARQQAEQAIALAPRAVWPREVLSHVLMQEGRDWLAAERALRDVLALQPNHSTALANLAVAQKALGR